MSTVFYQSLLGVQLLLALWGAPRFATREIAKPLVEKIAVWVPSVFLQAAESNHPGVARRAGQLYDHWLETELRRQPLSWFPPMALVYEEIRPGCQENLYVNFCAQARGQVGWWQGQRQPPQHFLGFARRDWIERAACRLLVLYLLDARGWTGREILLKLRHFRGEYGPVLREP